MEGKEGTMERLWRDYGGKMEGKWREKKGEGVMEGVRGKIKRDKDKLKKKKYIITKN